MDERKFTPEQAFRIMEGWMLLAGKVTVISGAASRMEIGFATATVRGAGCQGRHPRYRRRGRAGAAQNSAPSTAASRVM